MRFQKVEKERMKAISHFGWFIGGLAFFYWTSFYAKVLDNIMSNSQHITVWRTENFRISMLNWVLWLTLVLMAFYLNKRLFWIRENSKPGLLIRKYDALPVEKKHYYGVKLRYAASKWAQLLLWYFLMYVLEMLLFELPISWGRTAAELFLIAAAMGLIQGGALLLAVSQDWWSRKMGAAMEE